MSARFALDVFIPEYLPELNLKATGRHWATQMRHRNRARQFVTWYVAAANRPPEPLQRARVALIRSTPRLTHVDHENLAQSFKGVLDALGRSRHGPTRRSASGHPIPPRWIARADVIQDDRPQIIGQPTYATVKGPKGIRIVVRELGPDEPLDMPDRWWEPTP